MISVEQAWKEITDSMPELGSVRVPIERAGGCVLRQDVSADRDQPPFDRVTMDGIAIRAEAYEHGRRRFRIAGTQAAGAAALELGSDSECLEVMTGAVLPNGCDCVIPVEEIAVDGGLAQVDEGLKIEPGRFIHGRGTDYRAGTGLLRRGAILRSPEVAVLASVGIAEVEVARWPSVTVVSTGDELVDPGLPVAAHQVRRANDYAIAAALRAMGVSDVRLLHLRDDPNRMRAAVEGALADTEMLVLSGGVSKGKFDYLPGIFDALGVEKRFHRVRQRPGKPMWYGLAPSGRPVFALPGNPVSALVGLHRYVLPALHHAAGAQAHPEWVRLGVDLGFRDELAHFVPVDLDTDGDGAPVALPRELNTSGDFFGLAGSGGFVEIPERQTHCSAGATVRLFRW